jgi:hypothetical protein
VHQLLKLIEAHATLRKFLNNHFVDKISGSGYSGEISFRNCDENEKPNAGLEQKYLFSIFEGKGKLPDIYEISMKIKEFANALFFHLNLCEKSNIS